jgi:hypothetical protein
MVMSEKNVYVSLPVSVLVDAVQIRLQALASDLELLGQSAKRPTSEDLNEVYTELYCLSYALKTIEQEEEKE